MLSPISQGRFYKGYLQPSAFNAMVGLPTLWMLVFLITAAYCHMHGRIIDGEPLSWKGSLGYGVSRWVMWAALTPWIYRSLRKTFFSSNRLQRKIVRLLAGMALFWLLAVAGLALVVWLFAGEFPSNQRLARWMLYEWPKALAVYAGVAGFWLWQSKRQILDGIPVEANPGHSETKGVATENSSHEASQEKGSKAATLPKRLVVQTGRGTAIIEIAEIHWVGTARNYLEIHTPNRTYLLRQTMKCLEGQLDPKRFARIHRSAMVAYAQIEEIRSRPGGGYEVQLKHGHVLPMSKAYRDRLLANIPPATQRKPEYSDFLDLP